MDDHAGIPDGAKAAASVAVIYHSGYGHTERQAKAVREGIQEVSGAACLFLTTEEAPDHWDALAAVDAIVFGTPTYVAAASAAFKTFQEASSHAVMNTGYLWKDKLAAGFTNSGTRSGDKLATLTQLALFAAQHGMLWVSLDLPPANCSSAGSEDDLNRLGFWLGAGAQSNVDEGPDKGPTASDLATARHLGRRTARLALRFRAGADADVDAMRAPDLAGA